MRHRGDIAAPCKEEGEHCGSQQAPFQRTANDEEAQEEEEAHERTDIYGTNGHGLPAPIGGSDGRIVRGAHAEGRIDTTEGVLRQIVVLNGRECEHTLLCAATFEVGNEQGERFVHTITPLRDIVVVEARAGGLCCSLFALLGCGREFSWSAHGRLGVVVGVVEVGHIGQYADESARHEDGCTHQPLAEVDARQDSVGRGLRLRRHEGSNAVGQHDAEHHEAKVVAHLDVVAQNLERGEEGCHRTAPEPAAAIAENQSSNGGRHESKGHHLPDMAGGNDDEEVGREGPSHCANGRQPGAQAQRTHEDVEAQEINEHVAEDAVHPQRIDVGEERQLVGALVGRRNLVRGHTAEDTVGPAGGFACGFVEGRDIAAQSHGGIVVMASEDHAFRQRGLEIEKSDEQEGEHDEHIGQHLFEECLHERGG